MAVNVIEVATPDPFVTAVFIPPKNVPLWPDAGGVNVTIAFGTGLPPESLTTATSGLENAVLISVVCGVPPTAAMENGDPGRFVNENVAGTGAPVVVAVTE